MALNKDAHTQYVRTPEHHTHTQRERKLGSAVSPSAQRTASLGTACTRGSRAGPGGRSMSPAQRHSRTVSSLCNTADLTSSPYLTPSRCGLWPVDTSRTPGMSTHPSSLCCQVSGAQSVDFASPPLITMTTTLWISKQIILSLLGLVEFLPIESNIPEG